MKPRKRPGVAATQGRAVRKAIVEAKPIDKTLLNRKKISKQTARKEGRGGPRAHWETDYEEGNLYAKEKMPGGVQEDPLITPKRGLRH